MKKAIIFAIILPAMLWDVATYKVKSSAITFKIKNAGITVDGSFSGLEADIRFNPLKPEESSIKASVATNTLNTGNNMRDGHLRKPDYFDVEKYPRITLQSVKIEKTGPITFNGTFKLTMKNTTKEVLIPFLFMKTADKTTIKGSFSLNRLDYGVGESSMTLSDNASVTIVVELGE